jgi:hypothetical protein
MCNDTLRYLSGNHVSCEVQCHLPIAHCLLKHSFSKEEDSTIIVYVIKSKDIGLLFKGVTTGNMGTFFH